ncbi:RNA-directed DNA polymerase (Reverse transcriptase) [Trifolium medium]|uniref:RNA-directed DNA polymerase (Reverse transcriptase) n=1 Tax=Trifolium medium TaxID=97028 RepID=A0A392M7S8_9FABA|nr:RNA-directed DNA polymerase (Reverse transcriptase) [Trifolium medium]
MEALFDTSFLSWNIRGAQNNNARRHLKELIRRYNPTFLAILETHVPFANLSTFWNNNGYTPVHIIEAQGHSGGIWLLRLTNSNIHPTVLFTNQYSITFTINRGNATTTCTSIYASPNSSLRPALWNYLSNISHSIAGPWMMIDSTLITTLSFSALEDFHLTGDPDRSVLRQLGLTIMSTWIWSLNLGTLPITMPSQP